LGKIHYLSDIWSIFIMAGHSKWKQIKHKKAITDTKRGAKFTKLIKEITLAARTGGGDPAGNARLRLLLEKAKEINMPAENATRAIKRGTGELPGVSYEQILYEGYGPYGTAVLVDVLTDNKNKAVAELRHAFSKNGGTLAEAGAVSWMFEKKGEIRAEAGTMSEEQLLEKLLDYDVDNITLDEGIFTIHCSPKALEEVRAAVADLGLKIESAEFEWRPKNPITLDEEQTEKVFEFLSAIEDLDDVQNCYTNLA
jgi:YebC/PmpR family DNA-binding regulatory protein